MTLLLVAAGGAVGAPLRYLADRYLTGVYGDRFPWGTLLVNLAGTLLLGLLTGLAVPHDLRLLLAVGGCGALTTYSTFGFETVRLTERRDRLLAAAYVASTVAGTLGAALIGLAAGAAIHG